MSRARIVSVVVAAALAAAACGGDGAEPGADGERVQVVAAFYPLEEAARRVGGDRVDVTNLTAAGAEPHDLELTPGQVSAISDAGLVVVDGRGFQPAVEELAARRRGPTVVVLDELAATEGRAAEHEDEDGDAGALDPHVWLDPTLMREIVERVRDALSDVDPGGAAVYEERARRFGAELDALHAEYTEGLADCERRTIVTAHAAFGWLAARYDLVQEAVAGIAPDQEPSANRLAELADLVEREGITTVFTETLVSPRIAETLAREAGGVRTEVLNSIEGLTEDDLDQGHDYLALMRENLEQLRGALGCR